MLSLEAHFSNGISIAFATFSIAFTSMPTAEMFFFLGFYQYANDFFLPLFLLHFNLQREFFAICLCFAAFVCKFLFIFFFVLSFAYFCSCCCRQRRRHRRRSRWQFTVCLLMLLLTLLL